MKNFVVYLSLLILPLVSNALTLEEALIAAYKNNHSLNAQREHLKMEDEAIMKALSNWLPNINASIQKTYSQSKDGPLGKPPASRSNSSDSGTIPTLEIRQNLFKSGADVAAMKAAHFKIKAARAELEEIEQRAFLQTIQAYMNTLALSEVYRISQEQEKDYVTHLKAVKHKFAVGDTTKTEVSLVEAELAKAQSDKITTKASLDEWKARLEVLTNTSPKNLTLPKKNIKLPKTLHETIGISLQKNPKVIQLKNLSDFSKNNIEVAKGNVLPNVNLSYSITNYDNAKVFASDKSRINQSTVLTLNIPIFNGGESWSRIRENKRENARIKILSLKENEDKKAESLETWTKFEAEKASLEAEKAEYKARKQAYESYQKMQTAGLASILDVIKLRNNYFTSYKNLMNKRSNYYLAMYKLKSTIGECTAKGLELNTKLYDPLKNYNSIKWQLIGAF